jgi:hypothetical protein
MKYFHYRQEGTGVWYTDPSPFSQVAMAMDDLFVVIDDVGQTMPMDAEDHEEFLSVRAELARIEERVSGLDLAYRVKKGAASATHE